MVRLSGPDWSSHIDFEGQPMEGALPLSSHAAGLFADSVAVDNVGKVRLRQSRAAYRRGFGRSLTLP